MNDDNDVNDLIDFQVAKGGVSTIKCKDGQVFVFSADTLRRLLRNAEANDDGRATIFVKAQVAS